MSTRSQAIPSSLSRPLPEPLQEMQALLDALPPSPRETQEPGDRPVGRKDRVVPSGTATSADEDGFTLTTDQFKAGIRLAVSEIDGLILACPTCQKRRLVRARLRGSLFDVCADALGPEPICTFYQIVPTAKPSPALASRSAKASMKR